MSKNVVPASAKLLVRASFCVSSWRTTVRKVAYTEQHIYEREKEERLTHFITTHSWQR
jgi:hypothetical protein